MASTHSNDTLSSQDIRPQDGLAAVLRHHLVTNGNWTEPYTASGNLSYFENAAGHGIFVDETTAGVSALFGGNGADDVSTPTADRTPSSGLTYFRNYYSNVSSDPEKYDIWYDDYYFQIFHKFRVTDYYTAYIAFGRPPYLDNPNDTWGTVLLASNSNGSASNAQTAGHYLTQGTHWMRDAEGNVGSVALHRLSSYSAAGYGQAGKPFPLSGTVDTGSGHLVTVSDNAANNEPRATLPMFAPAHNEPFTVGDSITFVCPGDPRIDGKTGVVYDTYNSGQVVPIGW